MALGLLFVLPGQAQERPRNVILMIADGCGPASFTMARDYAREVLGQDALALDAIQVGAVQTRASNSRVTDSAASATAYACGVKTYNGAIAVDTARRAIPTVLEAAEAAGMATGLIATSRITHATPASFSAHVPSRSMEAEIARQQLQQGIEVLFGGGANFFLPTSEGGARTDSVNLLVQAAAQGYTVIRDRAGFDQPLTTPVLALFAGSHMDYEIDRTHQPSLAEMTTKALGLLDDDPDGFFLMVEGSRIDHAGHANDAPAHLHDILAYDAAVAVALAFAEADGETLVLSVSDHETGGLTVGRDGVYAWFPAALSRVNASLEGMGRALESGMPLDTMLVHLAGLDDLSDDERTNLGSIHGTNDRFGFARTLTNAISERAHLGWTTSGHTGVDVGLYAFGPGHAHFIGNYDNTHLGQAIATLLGFDLSRVQPKL